MTQKDWLSRVSRSRQSAQSTYDRLSRWYDWLAGPYEHRWSQAALDSLAVQAGETVLEIGPGTGRALLALALAVGATGQVCGLDLSNGMLRVAQARLRRALRVKQAAAPPADIPQAALQCGDALSLPFAANTFGAIFMSFTLELFDTPEIPQVLGECRRVLRPGGRIGVVGMSKACSSSSRPAVAVYEWLHRVFPRVIDCRPIYVCRALAAAGFEISQTDRFSMFGLPGERVMGHNPKADPVHRLVDDARRLAE